jgi:hypothetical protein
MPRHRLTIALAVALLGWAGAAGAQAPVTAGRIAGAGPIEDPLAAT